MPKLKEEYEYCSDCKKPFSSEFTHHCRGRCNPCYQRITRGNIKRAKKLDSCVKCGDKFETINKRGTLVKRIAHNLCARCYQFGRRTTSTCNVCGSGIKNGNIDGTCRGCKTRPTKIKSKLDKEILEIIRLLLVRYRVGSNTLVDNLRVLDIYLEVEPKAVNLDSLTEESQVVEMLRRLKKIYDFHKERMVI